MNIVSTPSPRTSGALNAGALMPVERMPGYTVEDDGDTPFSFDIRAILAILRRNALFIAGIVGIVLVAGLVVTLLTTPQYVASASVQIDQEADRVLNDSDSVQPQVAPQDADRFLQTQVDVLNSRAMAIRVAQALKLFDDTRFFDRMRLDPPSPRDGVDRRRQLRDAVLSELLGRLTVTLPRESRVVSLAFRSPDPAFAAEVANTYATEFIRNNLQRKYDSSDYARQFLSKQLAAAKTRLEASERDLNAYSRVAGLIKTGENGPSSSNATQSITTASLLQLNQSANVARSERVAAEQKWRTTASTPLMNIPEVLSNPAIQSLLQQRAQLQAQLSEDQSRHRDAYPTVLAFQAQLKQIDGQIQVLAENIRNSIRDQYQVAVRQESSLDGQVAALKGDTLAEQDRSVRYNILAREADTNRTLYDGLLQRFKEVSAAAGITTNNISMVDNADIPPFPSSPRLFLNLFLALLFGFALAGALVFVREQIDDAVRVPEDMERKLGLPALGAIPLVKADEDMLEMLEAPRSAVSEAYHALRTSLLYASAESLPRILLVTSSQSGEGKSTTSFAIASDLAKLDKRVVLVDTDLRRPSLHRVLDVRNEYGLSSLLTAQAGLDRSLVETATPNLKFIPSGPIPPSPTELLGSARMRQLLDRLADEYDVVVLDGPPVLGLADAPMLAALAEGTIFVVEASRGHRGSTKTAVRRLQSAHSRILGGVLTKFDPKKAGSGQYYGYEYYYYGMGNDSKAAPKLT